MSANELEAIISKFDKLTQKPTKFLSVQNEIRDDLKVLVKSLYDFTKSTENSSNKPKKDALRELIIQDFDEEQIWQQIELQNTECWDQLVWDVSDCMSKKELLEFPLKEAKDNQNEYESEESEDEANKEMSENESLQYSEDEEDLPETSSKLKEVKQKRKGKPSVVDDKFFKLKEMEQFLIKEEQSGGKVMDKDSDSESIDLFEEIDDEESGDDNDGGKGVMYGDFFQNDESEAQENLQDDELPERASKNKDKRKRVTFIDQPMTDEDDNDKDASKEASSDNDDDSSQESDIDPQKNKNQNTNDKKSEFELRQQRLKQHISKLEEKTLSEAPWQLKGEVDALKRPQNSLLENVVDFDLTTRPAPIITEQTTLTLEEIIRQRIKDKAWDDVEKKEKPVEDQLAFRKMEVLDHSKSKLSLAQVYEAEYLKQKQASADGNENEKEPESHQEIREAMDKLFSKLDALCHYHYTPKPAQPEVKIVSNTPAIMMEEVAPTSVSDAALLAPEEVKRKRKGDLMNKEERSSTDKKRERRKKKVHQSKKGHVAKVTEQRNTKKAEVSNEDKALKTSKAFFQQLNDDTTSLIKNKKKTKNKGQ